ncbi:MAG: UDP-N-acetylmuramate--L-alanine ligase [Lactobacillus sp.]|uniref:UDP-N-acetylmuramate--L-alanine ligase n=1 Tax=Lacticaseibacillus suilingensis TaxID=2799577 RepID=A0ABW4BH11_9LACO|nr:UDP-N-acetylmuramate--L-alanine ligase [Lacticaseibacillus suilingensis]MCI1894866.1 UDP-N-acetylmuramate--L-alanine ligase [Lactobacillus sp.]MCI1917470.1 UDP-N-acetylmuramate--L-alanine ligase [Lactobacillus sp.]MCI1940625.1 UDP-N-acetylmuramate--L-alanine ligase [Lactobacillus sp.]MCI1971311.1 UDP-N-acetylmuramate--L-alanine ligase [Lactobacillus sp.]MCI2017786.1 UDP-N-acetylmuramate--L-alanine ligase [Lactobacillus sp.]
MTEEIDYFIGIKGSGMSALALILHDLGHQVLGSDITQYTFTQKGLEAAGIETLPFDAANIKPGYTIICGNSFTDEHPEVKAAKALGLKFYRYHEYLGELLSHYTSIGVAGAHGKTSTTGLLAHTLSGIDKTSYLIGDGTGKGTPDSKFFVFEADEYRRHFLAYSPDYLIMTNIDFDHPDYYTGIEDVYDAFETEGKQVKKAIFAWGDDPWLRKLDVKVPVYYYGESDQDDYQAKNIKRTPEGSSFDAYHKDQLLGHFFVPLFGEHSVLNALAVVAVSDAEGLNPDYIARELASFSGVKRRFSETDLNGTVIIDDYAHHPNEIKATLDAARQKFPDRELVAVFQPHTYSRTIAYLDDFAQVLSQADAVYVTPIFSSARETSGSVSAEDVVAKLKNGGEVLHEDDMTSLLKHKNAAIVFMGAGDVQKYERAFEAKL